MYLKLLVKTLHECVRFGKYSTIESNMDNFTIKKKITKNCSKNYCFVFKTLIILI